MVQAGQAARALEAHARAVDAAYRRSGGMRWQVSAEVFGAAVRVSVAKRFGTAPLEADAIDAFIDGLHAEDLALACACRDGHGQAWDHFVLTFRPELYRAARAIAGEQGRELADSLYADLFGLTETDGVRRSLLSYYHGRSRLGTWLRSVLAQRHVDVIRAGRRTSSLDDPESPAAEPAVEAATVEPDIAERMRVAADCISAAIAALDATSRLRLAYCYVHGLTLAETARLFGEHEATASRKLDKARGALRGGIERLLAEQGLQSRDVESWSDVARQAWDAALAEALDVGAPARDEPQGAAGPSFKGKRTP